MNNRRNSVKPSEDRRKRSNSRRAEKSTRRGTDHFTVEYANDLLHRGHFDARAERRSKLAFFERANQEIKLAEKSRRARQKKLDNQKSG